MSERHAAFVMQPRTGPQRRAGPLPSGGSIADGPTAKSAPCLSAHRTALRCFFQRLPRNGPVGRLSAAFSNPPLQASPLHRAFFARGQKPACTEIFRLIYRPDAAFFGIRSFYMRAGKTATPSQKCCGVGPMPAARHLFCLFAQLPLNRTKSFSNVCHIFRNYFFAIACPFRIRYTSIIVVQYRASRLHKCTLFGVFSLCRKGVFFCSSAPCGFPRRRSKIFFTVKERKKNETFQTMAFSSAGAGHGRLAADHCGPRTGAGSH